MKNTPTLLSAAIGAACAASLVSVLRQMGIGFVVAVVTATVLATVLQVGMDQFWRLLMQRRWVRHLFDRRSDYEGDWIEHFEKAGKKYYSITTLTFNKSAGDFRISGTAFSDDFAPHASWNGSELHIDADNLLMTYRYTSNEINATSSEQIEGLAMVRFTPSTQGAINFGFGYLLDGGSVPRQSFFEIHRLTSTFIESALGTSKITRFEELSSLVKQYAKLTTADQKPTPADPAQDTTCALPIHSSVGIHSVRKSI